MKRTIRLGVALLFSSIGAFAQQPILQCGTDQYNNELKARYPELQKQEEAFKTYWEQFKQTDTYKRAISPSAKKAAAPKYIIPVVVHVFANNKNEPSNISDAQIQSEIDFLNKSFRNLNADSVNRRVGVMNGLPYDYKVLAGDAEIEFRLARKDPNGNCTNGIVRVATPFDKKGNDNLKKNSVWDAQRYLNMWVVEKIDRGPGIALAGYAQMPFSTGGPWSAMSDGVMILSVEFGQIGTATPNPSEESNKTTVTHELGHWLGLYHPFQGSDGDSCGLAGDGIEDTPPTYFKPTPDEPLRKKCNVVNFNSCATDKVNGVPYDRPDMMENFMDYFTGPCAANMFTLQQIARMHYCLENYRSKLVSQENLVFTGVLNAASTCAPIPAFGLNINGALMFNRQVCVGTPVSFTDLSYNGQATSYSWDFGDGASPQTSTASNPSGVTYSTAGYKNITLTVSNGSGSNTKVFNQAILVTQSSSLNYHAFNPDYPVLDDGWVMNDDEFGKWELVTMGVYSGAKAIKLAGNNMNMYAKEYSVVSPPYDFSAASAPYFKFMYAFAQNKISPEFSSEDVLHVQYSVNCGLSWKEMISPLVGEALSTINAPLSSSIDFVPVNQSQWKEITVPTNDIPRTANVRFRLLFESQAGNNLFIDHFQFGQKTGLSELTANDIKLNVYPNPLSTSTKITYTLPASAQATIEVFDVVGKKVADVYAGKQQEGAQEIIFDRNAYGIGSGLYFVKIKVENSVITQKILIH